MQSISPQEFDSVLLWTSCRLCAIFTEVLRAACYLVPADSSSASSWLCKPGIRSTSRSIVEKGGFDSPYGRGNATKFLLFVALVGFAVMHTIVFFCPITGWCFASFSFNRCSRPNLIRGGRFLVINGLLAVHVLLLILRVIISLMSISAGDPQPNDGQVPQK